MDEQGVKERIVECAWWIVPFGPNVIGRFPTLVESEITRYPSGRQDVTIFAQPLQIDGVRPI